MFIEAFKITGVAVSQIFFLGAIGYLLVKKNILGDAGLDSLSRLTLDITLPVLIFCQLTRDFSFTKYPDWWLFPLISLGITLVGLIIGLIFISLIHGHARKLQFLSLIAFQNSGYLPIALIAALLPAEKAGVMFIYLFLFLLGFNAVMFSMGVYLLAFSKAKKFELGSLFNPPVLATLLGLFLVFIGINKVPDFIFKPLKMLGDTTLPLAMLVVGGNLAQINLGRIHKRDITFLILAKLVILPALGLLLLLQLKVPELIALLVLIELAVPSATTLSVITRHYKKEDLLISQGIFSSHIVSLVTIPVFLSLYFIMRMQWAK